MQDEIMLVLIVILAFLSLILAFSNTRICNVCKRVRKIKGQDTNGGFVCVKCSKKLDNIAKGSKKLDNIAKELFNMLQKEEEKPKEDKN